MYSEPVVDPTGGYSILSVDLNPDGGPCSCKSRVRPRQHIPPGQEGCHSTLERMNQAVVFVVCALVLLTLSTALMHT
jgi:hypothetical protein